MLIEDVKFVEFGPFHGEHEIKFPNGGNGVHLIHGQNGHGKTSILRGILWGLYGRVHDRTGQEIRPTSLLNRTAQRDGTFRFGVVIRFNHDGEQWTITRKMEARSLSDKAFEAGMHLSLVKDGEVVPNPEQAIRRLLPEDVSRFFFFDGEMLQDYEELLDQSSGSMAMLRDSIEHVLGIPFLGIGRDDLVEVQRRLENERARLVRRLGGTSFNELVDEFQALSEKIVKDEQTVKALDTSMAQLEVEITDLKRKLVEVSQVRELAEERITLDRDIEQLEAKKNTRQEQVRALLKDLYKTVVARSSEDIIEKLRRRHDETMMKYNEKMQLRGEERQIDQAIQSSKCKLCGTVLDAAKLRELRADLKEVQAKIKDLTEVPEPNLEYDNHVTRLEALRGGMIRSIEFSEAEAFIVEVDHEMAAKKARLTEVKRRLEGVDQDEPRRIAADIEARSDEKGRLKEKKEELGRQRVDDLERKSELDQKLQGIDQAELRDLSNRIELVKPLGSLFEEAIGAYRDEKRLEVGKSAVEIFKKLRTKASFARLDINPQFGLKIITNDGQVLDRAEWRSSGEEQVVALALIGALNRSAKVSAAVFMDTPFGRLDTKHGEKVLTFVPEMSEQVVLLVTDREFRKEDARFLTGSVKSEFTVMHQSEKEGSTISPTKA